MPPKTSSTDVALLKQDLSYLKSGIDDIKCQIKNMGEDKVSKTEFHLVNKRQDENIKQIQNLVFGAVGLTLVSIGKIVIDMVLDWKQ